MKVEKLNLYLLKALDESSLITIKDQDLKTTINSEDFFNLFFKRKLSESTSLLEVISHDEIDFNDPKMPKYTFDFEFTLIPNENIKSLTSEEVTSLLPRFEKYWEQFTAFLDEEIEEYIQHEIKEISNNHEISKEIDSTELETHIKSRLKESYIEHKDKILEGLICQLESFSFHVLDHLIDNMEEYLLDVYLKEDSKILKHLGESNLKKLSSVLCNFIITKLKPILKLGLLEWTERYLVEITNLLIQEQQWLPWNEESLSILKELLAQDKEGHKAPIVDLTAEKIRDIIPMPINPIFRAAIEAAYNNDKWEEDYNTLIYEHTTRQDDTHIILYFPKETRENFSTETVDVFLILMSKIAELRNPTDIAIVTLSELADYRNVAVRSGSRSNLLDDLKQEVLRLGNIRLSIKVSNRGENNAQFGIENPDRLLDIVDMEQHNRDTAFSFRCGQALSYFLSGDSRWIGYYSRKILELNPYQESFTKKVGTYWLLTGIIAYQYNQLPHAKPSTILNFCGEGIDSSNPGRTVDKFINAHIRLAELGIIKEGPPLEPEERNRGYINDWMDMNIEIELSEDIWQMKKQVDTDSPQQQVQPNTTSSSNKLPTVDELTPEILQENPKLIRKFRERFYLNQEEVASQLRISRSMLSRYETGSSQLPDSHASNLIDIFRKKM